MNYMSVCSGIEAASVAWEPMGWAPVAFAEIEPFPAAVLAYRWPDVPNVGNMENLLKHHHGKTFDILVGGTPCQSFSVAGLRRGLDDPRGNLMLTFGAIADTYRPRWLLWENVPGVLSSNRGRDFGTFLGMLAQIGYGFAYRVLDAQYFGVPQRRRRVFVVGHLGDWRRAAAVLFESQCMQGCPAPGGKKKTTVAAITANGVGTCGADDNQGQAGHLIPATYDKVSRCLNAGGGRLDYETESFFVHGIHGTLGPRTNHNVALSIHENQRSEVTLNSLCGTIKCGGGKPGQGYPAIPYQASVRRLTPVECERLQGFPDNHTRIPWRGKPAEQCPDGPRYRAIGNSMAVPVMRWIGKRIEQYDTTGDKQ